MITIVSTPQGEEIIARVSDIITASKNLQNNIATKLLIQCQGIHPMSDAALRVHEYDRRIVIGALREVSHAQRPT